MFDMVVVERDVIFVFACCGEYGTSTMPSISFIRCYQSRSLCFLLHILSTSSVFASAFSQITPAAAEFFSFACAFLPSLSACAAALFVVAVFYYYFLNDLLVLFRAQASRLQVFSAWSRSSYSIVYCFLVCSSQAWIVVNIRTLSSLRHAP